MPVTELTKSVTGTAWHAPSWRDVFNINTTGLRWADAILTGEPEALLHYGVTGRLVWMSPDQYCIMQAEAKGQPVAVDLSKVDQTKVDNYANMMRTTGAAHFPVCIARPGGQDGRHRALAAKQVGIKTIPVFVMSRLTGKEAAALIPKDCVLRYEPCAPDWVQVNVEAAKRESDHKFPMGKNGNILVGYEKPPVTTLAKCDKCGRLLTTKYWVWDKARQEIIVVGAEHLPDAMGRFRLLPKKLRHWERKLTKLQELAQVEKSMAVGAERPGHKYIRREPGTGGKRKYVYKEATPRAPAAPEEQTAPQAPPVVIPRPQYVPPATALPTPQSVARAQREVKAADNEERTVYHGTHAEAAQGIRERGFVPAATRGISGTSNSTFVFVAPYKESAEWYAKNNINIKKESATVIAAKMKGRILDTNATDDYKAAHDVAVKLGVQPESQSMFDWKQVAEALQKHGYVGFSFKDRSGSNRRSFAVLPSALAVAEKTPKSGIEKIKTVSCKPEEYVSLRNKLPEHCRNFLTPYDAAHYKDEGTKTFGMKLGTGAIGYTLSKDGDFGGFYNTSGVKGAGANCLIEAIGHGAKTLDCIGDGLSHYYKWFGFEEYKRDKWNPEYAPKDWETDPLTRGTKPDIVYMKFTGASRDPETVRKLYEEHRSGKGTTGEGRPQESGRPGASGGADGRPEGQHQGQVGAEAGTPQHVTPARLVKGYEPLPTADACAAFAKDKLGLESVDYKHLDPETANAINMALFLEKQTLGSVSFSKIGTTISLPEHNNLNGGKPHGMLMQTWWEQYSSKHKPELQINVGAMNRWLPKAPKGKHLGFHVADSAGNRQRGLIAAVTHEIGHSMWLKLSPHDRRSFTKIAQNEMNNLFASAGGDVEVHVPSDYAATSVAEMWAECFASYQTGLAVDKVPAKALKILKHNFKKATA